MCFKVASLLYSEVSCSATVGWAVCAASHLPEVHSMLALNASCCRSLSVTCSGLMALRVDSVSQGPCMHCLRGTSSLAVKEKGQNHFLYHAVSMLSFLSLRAVEPLGPAMTYD